MVERNLLNGVIELHVHPAPDIQPRKFTDMELAEQMKEVQAAAVVLKSHTFPTMARAEIVSRLTGFSVFGSITLNDEVGDLIRLRWRRLLTLVRKRYGCLQKARQTTESILIFREGCMP